MLQSRVYFTWAAIVGMAAIAMGLYSCKRKSADTNLGFSLAPSSAQSGVNVALLFAGNGRGGIADGIRSDLCILGKRMAQLGFVEPKREILGELSTEVRSYADNCSWLGSYDPNGPYGQVNLERMPAGLGMPLAGFNASKIASVNEISRISSSGVGQSGTMFWFISTHGAPDAGLEMGTPESNQPQHPLLYLKETVPLMVASRNGTPFKRLVMLIEACYSGSSVSGANAIVNNASEYSDVFRKLADEVIILTSSSAQQLSRAPGNGSYAVQAFDEALSETCKFGGQGKTIKNFVDIMSISLKRVSNQAQDLTYTVLPKAAENAPFNCAGFSPDLP